MRYKNAAQILPPELLRQVQTYVDGEFLYIPRLPERRRSWGETTATRRELLDRNRSIYAGYLSGETPETLAKQYYLSEKSIYRILRMTRRKGPDPMNIIQLKDHPERIPAAAAWFHEKWKVPVEAYLESMEASLTAAGGVPAWYVCLGPKDEFIAGIGVIENDFHKRPDLTPNLCALYVEEPYRNRGIARALLDRACRGLFEKGIGTAYLITSHTAFYERCGWQFYGMIEEDDGNMIRMYQKTTGA